jgi:hypothetical protein
LLEIMLELYDSGQRLSKLTDVFVVSFTELDDDPEMWNEHGDEGRGCAIGFRDIAGEQKGIRPGQQVVSIMLCMRYDLEALRTECQAEPERVTLAVRARTDAHLRTRAT